MPWLKKHSVLRKQLREEGLYVPGQSFVQQVTALYEKRIAAVEKTPDAGKRYLALQGILDEMQGYADENDRLIKRKAEISAGESKTPALLGAFALAGVAVATVAFFTLAGGLSTLLSEFAFGMVGLGELLAFSGIVSLATEGRKPDHFENLAKNENAAFAALASKIQTKMAVISTPPSPQQFLQYVRATALDKFSQAKNSLLYSFSDAASKPSATQNNAQANNPRPIVLE